MIQGLEIAIILTLCGYMLWDLRRCFMLWIENRKLRKRIKELEMGRNGVKRGGKEE